MTVWSGEFRLAGAQISPSAARLHASATTAGENPRALSASVKTAFAAGYFSARSLPMPGYCEACPGKTNATLPIANPSHAPSRDDRGGGELLFDFLVHARAGESRGHANGVFHGVGIRTSVTDDADAADA